MNAFISTVAWIPPPDRSLPWRGHAAHHQENGRRPLSRYIGKQYARWDRGETLESAHRANDSGNYWTCVHCHRQAERVQQFPPHGWHWLKISGPFTRDNIYPGWYCYCKGAEADVLTMDQVRRLTATPRVVVNRSAEVEPGDHRLLDLLVRDGRASNADLARATGLSVGRVVRRLEALESSGAIYFDVDIALAALGNLTAVLLWLQVSPARLDAVGRAMAEHSEVPFAAAIAGKDNLVASATCESLDGLYTYLTEKVAIIDGINGYEISLVMKWIKQAGAVAAGDRLADPEPPSRIPRRGVRVAT